MTSSQPVRVSVIVPVFRPGPGFDELMHSLDEQTLASDEFEVILCDDGSGEPTGKRLRHIASTRPNVRVLTLEHTGWPGTPRNHGIAAARGTYVFFSDQDDRLFPNALTDLCDYADQHSSDVVVGKVVGVGRGIPRAIFRHDVPNAVLGKDPLLGLLTPHKLFRTTFLRENDIRFPDGKVRLEDHLFVMQAYFRASTISVLASRPIYAWLKNKGSASSSRIDPDTYFPYLEAVLDIVEANTEPGALRDTLLRHWYRSKILQRMTGTRLMRYPDEYRARFIDVVTPLAQARFGQGVEDGLALPLRIRSALLRADARDELLRFAEFEAALQCRAEVTAARWTRGGRLALAVDVRVTRAGEDALEFERAEGTSGSSVDAVAGSSAENADAAKRPPSVWRPPADLGLDVLPAGTRDARRDLRGDQVELLLHDESGDDERRIPGRFSLTGTSAKVTIDPLRIFGRRDHSPGGRIIVQVRRADWRFETPLRVGRQGISSLGRSPLLAGRRTALVERSDGTVALRRASGGAIVDLGARAARRSVAVVRRILPER